MRKIFFLLIISLLFNNCRQFADKHYGEASSINTEKNSNFHLLLPASLERRHAEFENDVTTALVDIHEFAAKYGWQELTKKPFIDSIMIFDDKKMFDKTLLKIAGADTTMILPETYCAALENRILMAVSPEIYANVYPQGIEENSYIKLLTHEIAHRLHVRILHGDEDAMGPVWFYEGFAIFAAGKFADSEIQLSEEEMMQIMNDPERGSYLNYGYIFRYFAKKVPMKELVEHAGNKDFNEWLLKRL